ncbi:MAG: hydrolase 1, exosortase system-associated [Rhodocyclaceae bacterium]|nr:hydrolase 1, exosortase system-associated [Rhodocyclaceae bacterium]
MKYVERPLLFPCAGKQLVGILAQPERHSPIGVVIVVGGPQYRAGSHRQFVSLARALAAGGYPVLRFDYRGMGDSSGEMRGFEAVGEDIGGAVAALHGACPEATRTVLWGLCDGASAALLYWDECRDPRIDGLVLVNPWIRSEATQARTQVKHYYGQRLLQREFWLKLLRGNVALGDSLLELGHKIGLSVARAAPSGQLSYHARMARAWRDFPGQLLLILSGQDYVAKEFLEYARSDAAWSGFLDRPGAERIDLAAADHTFSAKGQQEGLETAVLGWLERQAWEAERLAG